MRRDLDGRAQHLAGKAGRQSLEARAHMAALGVVVVRQERLAVRAGCTRVEGPGFAQSLVGELDPRAPRVLAEDVGNGLPEGAGLFRFAGFGEEARSEEHTSELQSQSNLVCR